MPGNGNEANQASSASSTGSVNIRLPPQLNVNGDVAKSWKDWKQQFTWYSTVVDLEKKPEEVKIAIFMTAIGPEAVSVYNTFPEEKKAKLDSLMKAFEAYFTPKVNITYERFLFNKIVQGENEKFDDFLTDLLSRSKTCEFGTLHDGLVRDRIVIGVYRDADREKLLAVKPWMERDERLSQVATVFSPGRKCRFRF